MRGWQHRTSDGVEIVAQAALRALLRRMLRVVPQRGQWVWYVARHLADVSRPCWWSAAMNMPCRLCDDGMAMSFGWVFTLLLSAFVGRSHCIF